MKKAFALILVLVMLCMPTVVLAEDNYINSEEFFTNGSRDYAVDANYEYTVFTLEPSEIGTYYISSTNALLGIVSYNGMWVTINPSSETVCENSISWDCTGVGQSIWVAVKAEGDTANITVSDEELIIVEIPREEYKNTAKLAPFTYEGDADELVYVDIEDDVAESAVLGEDGFYHLNSADGAILYIDLDDPMMNLADAMSYGQLKGVVYDGDTVVKIVDYNNAFAEYINYADEETMLYPLTADIIEIYKEVGNYQGWYGEDGWVGGTEEDAWMFACYYDENYKAPSELTLGDVNSDGDIDKYDYILVKRAVMGTIDLDETQLLAADVNKKDGVEKYDYILIKRHVMGTYTIEG